MNKFGGPPARRDANEAELVATADAFAVKRKMRLGVERISQTGVPDLLLGFRGRNLLLEVKNPNGKSPAQRALTPDPRAWWAAWPGQKLIVETASDVRRAILQHEASARIEHLAPFVADLVETVLHGKPADDTLPRARLREFVAWTRALEESKQ